METQLVLIQTNSGTFKAFAPAFLHHCRVCDRKHVLMHIGLHHPDEKKHYQTVTYVYCYTPNG